MQSLSGNVFAVAAFSAGLTFSLAGLDQRLVVDSFFFLILGCQTQELPSRELDLSEDVVISSALDSGSAYLVDEIHPSGEFIHVLVAYV